MDHIPLVPPIGVVPTSMGPVPVDSLRGREYYLHNSRRWILLESILFPSPALFTSPIFCPTKKTFLPLIRADFGYFWLNLGLILVNFDSFWLILAYFWGIVANFGQNHLNSHAKSNLPGYLYVMNSNFVNTEPIFKIRNSAESYCLAELPFSFPKFPKFAIFLPPPPPHARKI